MATVGEDLEVDDVAHGSTAVLIVDDHMMIAEAMVAAMEAAGFSPVRYAPADSLDERAVADLASSLRPDVALVDLNLGCASGLSVIRALTAQGVRVVAFSADESSLAAAGAIEAGAVGFLNKGERFEVIADHLRRAAAGEPLVGVTRREEMLAELREARRVDNDRLRVFDTLSPKEREVLRALAAGRSAQEIADDTYLSVKTVRSHIEAIRSKLNVRSQLAAVALAREAGWNG